MPLLAVPVSEAAKLAGIPKTLLEARIVLGRGPKARKLGSRYVILVKDLEDWLESLPQTDLTTAEDVEGGMS